MDDRQASDLIVELRKLIQDFKKEKKELANNGKPKEYYLASLGIRKF